MITTALLIIHIMLLGGQYFIDGRRIEVFNPKTLFQVYFIIQLPCVLYIGVNFNVPGFLNLSPSTPVDEILKLGLLFLFAHLLFLLAYYSIGARAIHINLFNKIIWNYRRAQILCALLFGSGYIMVFYLFEINGGYTNFVENRESWRAGGMVGQGWILFPATSMLSLAASVLLIVRGKSFAGNHGLAKLIMLIGAAALPASQLGFRGLILLPAVQLLFLYHFRIQRLKFGKIFPLLFIIVVIFTVYGIYRESNYLMTEGFDINIAMKFIAERPEFLFSIILRSKGADIVASVINQINDLSDFAYFVPAIFESLTIMIPTALWPDKPIPQGVIFSTKFFGLGGGVSATVVGDAYWQAGILGVLFVMIFLGIVFRLFANGVNQFSSNDSLILVSASIFPSLVMTAEAVQTYLNGIVLIILFNLFMIFFISIKMGPRRERIIRLP